MSLLEERKGEEERVIFALYKCTIGTNHVDTSEVFYHYHNLFIRNPPKPGTKLLTQREVKLVWNNFVYACVVAELKKRFERLDGRVSGLEICWVKD